MIKCNYNEYLEIVNGIVEKPQEDNGYWNIDDIINRNSYYEANVLHDNKFRIFVDCKDEQAINELVEFLKSKGFIVENPGDSYLIKELYKSLNIPYEEQKDVIIFDDDIYSFAFYPTNKDIETYYMFLDNYLEDIVAISNKYNTEIIFHYDQLDDAITGSLIIRDNGIGTAGRIFTEMVPRNIYIATCMLKQLANSQQELEELFVEIYVQDSEMVVIDENNQNDESNQELLKLIEEGNAEVVCEFDENLSKEEIIKKVQEYMNKTDSNYN